MVQDVLRDEVTGHSTHTIRGIATAASVWLSAAVGVACGGGLYFAATFTSTLLMVLLRFGPRSATVVARRRTSSTNRDGGASVLPVTSTIHPERRRDECEFVKSRGMARSQSLSFD